MSRLYDGAWVLVTGQAVAQPAIECLNGIFRVADGLYREDGHAVDRFLGRPAIQMILDFQTARENGLLPG
ncbi:hypothetical protein [Asticcacaulis excentricus]|uniref:Acriflavin resistance protein n=1 Tax=Asticcacaulis excentricus (strain ATCC 15261 / DSM 4724 / KCTC 12464 / NCIMB 9791 / VKM B-1370 / CB 48) TaxID=573065 RepID=E8RU17_ASTEC|nr:hypothetical protein [Asticcacaulis excentricus]ADU14988.1 acriflavin resistance protein [Asticcacaulis excentricus CB 48]